MAPGMMPGPAGRDDHAEIREEVRRFCARLPGGYWRKLDEGDRA